MSAAIAGVLVILVALAAVLFPRMSPPEEPEATPTPEPVTISEELAEPVAGGVYIEADVGFPETLNPLLATTVSERTITTLLYRGLIQPDHQGVPAPDLAREWAISEDGRRYEVTLMDDIYWHDGEPVRAADVLFTIALIQDAEFPGDQSLSRFWRAITVSRVDEQTVAFELLEPYAGFMNFLSLPILPRHVFGSYMPSDFVAHDLESPVVGTGPFMIDTIDDQSREIRLLASESSARRPLLDEIVFRYFDTRADAYESFRNGDADGISFVSLDKVQNREELPEGTQILAPSLSGYTALYFNTRHQILQDVQTRRAIELAIDRHALIDRVLGGHAVAGSSPIPEMLAAHDEASERHYDPGEATALLESQGWVLVDGDEIRQRDGQRLIFGLLVNGDDAQRVALAVSIQEMLRDTGIGVEVQTLPGGDVHQALQSRQFASVLYGWHTETGDPDCFQMWHSSQIEAGQNFTGFAHSEADELLVNARRSVDLNQRNAYYERFQEVFAEQVPAVVLFYPRYHFAVSEKVQGAEPVPLLNPSDRIRQVHYWYVTDRAPSEPSGG